MTRTKNFAVCPHCDATDSPVDHLLPGQSAGPWYCDSCGKAYTLKVGLDGLVAITPTDAWKVETLDVLILHPQPKPLIFAVPGMRFNGNKELVDHKHYYYEEHSCPTNWLRPDFMYYDGDTDPHGVIRFSGHCRDDHWDRVDHDSRSEMEAELTRIAESLL